MPGGTPRRPSRVRLPRRRPGYVTKNPPVRRPRVTLQARIRARYKPPVHSIIRRPFGVLTRKPPVRRPVTVTLQARIRARYKPPVHSIIRRVVRTFAPLSPRPKPIRVVSFAARQRALQPRYKGTVRVRAVVRTFTPGLIPNLHRLFQTTDGALFLRVNGTSPLLERMS